MKKNLSYFKEIFAANDTNAALEKIMANTDLWGNDFCSWSDFHKRVLQYAEMIQETGAYHVMKMLNQGKIHELA